jgi:hypothetical protein
MKVENPNDKTTKGNYKTEEKKNKIPGSNSLQNKIMTSVEPFVYGVSQ